MARHVIRLAVVLVTSVLVSVGHGDPSEEPVSEPAVATVETAADANEAGGEDVGREFIEAVTRENDANQPAAMARGIFDPNTDPNLVAWWKLDGDAADSSGNGLAGIPVGEPNWVEGRIGGAVALGGVDDYIDCGNPTALALKNELTVACWIKVEAFTRRWETILAKGNGSYRLSRPFAMGRTAHFACDGTEPEPAWLNGKTVLTDNRWHHIAAVYDGVHMIVYVDGREDARKPASGQVADNECAFCIGENIEQPERFLKGLVDDVRIYGRALGPGEIEALVGPGVMAAGKAEEPAAGPIGPAVPQPGKRTNYLNTALLVGSLLVLVGVIVVAMLPSRKGQGGEPGLAWKIARKELLLNLMTFKFAAAMVVCVVLTAVFVPMLAKDYQERVKTYRDNVSHNEAELRTVKVYKNITPNVYRPPSVLSAFSEGLEKRIADAMTLELNKVPEMRGAATEGNPYQAVFPVFDASLIFKIVLSILALLVAYDAVSGERERGTLKLVLSGATRRHRVLMAKLLAGLLVLAVPVTLTFLVGLVILLSFPLVSLSTSDWGRIGMMYIASLVFVSAMYNVGLLFSCLTRKSAISLVLGLFLWVLFAIIVPNGSVYVAAELRPSESQENIDAQLAVLSEEFDTERRIRMDEQRTRDAPSNTAQSDAKDSFGRGYHRLLNKAYLEYEQERYQLQFPLEIRYAERAWEAQRRRLNSLYEQKRLADHLSKISPISLYDGVMSTLAGTDMAAFQRFSDAARAYRAEIVEYVRAKTENFSSSLFFTPCTKEEAEEYERFIAQSREVKTPEEAAALMQRARPLFEKMYAETANLDLRDFPAFRVPGALGDVGRAIPGLALLIFVNMLFFALSFVAFMRYDVR